MSPLRGPHQIVGIDGIALVFHGRHPVGGHGKAPGQKDNDYAAAMIGAGVIDGADFLPQDRAIPGYPRLELNDQRLGVTGGLENFLPAIDDLHRQVAFHGEQGADVFVVEEVDLAAKGPADIGLQNSHLAVGQAEGFGQFGPFDKDPHAGRPDL